MVPEGQKLAMWPGRHGTCEGAVGPRARLWGTEYFSVYHKKHISGAFCLFCVVLCFTWDDLEAGLEGMKLEGS